MSNQIETGKIFIKDAFRWWYRVPEYQRPYVWGRDQVNDLLDDVTFALQNKPDAEYFLGSIVLQTRQVPDPAGKSFEERDLLDGQQRLTTCLMLHAIGRDLTQDLTLKQTCDESVFQKENKYDNIPERLRIMFDVRDVVRDFATKFLKSDGGTNDEAGLRNEMNSVDASVRNLATAVLEIRRYFKEEEGAPTIEEFFPFFRNKVMLIYVASTQLEDAFRLFTVLNDRGMKLRNSDILKTKNLGALKENGASTADQRRAAQIWEEMEGEFGEDFDVFLSHLRTILVKEKARLNLLQEFEENIYAPRVFDKDTKKYRRLPPLLKEGRDTFDFMKRYRGHYLQIFSGNNHHIDSSWEFDNLITLLTGAGLADFWIPPLLHFREVFGEERITEFLKKLENKFSGDWIARETPTSRIEGMNAILKRIDLVRGDSNLARQQQIEALLLSEVFDYNKNEFLTQLDNSAVYGRRFARYVVYKLDLIFGGKGNRLQPPKEISVEHVLPQNPEAGSEWCRHYTEQEREVWTDRVGNLVLISGRKNTQQGRLDYTLKKKRYFEKNIETFPNSLRVLNANDQWTLAELKNNHALVLAKLKEYGN